MERFDASEGDWSAGMVDAARAGVEVEIAEAGAMVARMVKPWSASFKERMETRWQSLPAELRTIHWRGEIAQGRRDEWS